jgi:histone acetyltransferase (RNA polymerase elongator complex component)
MPPIIIPVFLTSLGCRERCLFCNQKVLGEGLSSPSSVRRFIEDSICKLPRDQKDGEKQIAFYGGSFTAVSRDSQIAYLKEVQSFTDRGIIQSIRISTRPDGLGEETLSLLKEYGVKTVEVGAQSMIDEVLLLSHRGHKAEETASALLRLKQRGFETGLHLMIGLLGDTCDRFLLTIDKVIELRPDFVRIHPTLVLKGTSLETLWREGKYTPLSLDEAVDWLKKGMTKLERSSIAVARVGLQPTEALKSDFLAGPFHPALHQLVDSAIFFDMAQYLIHNFLEAAEATFICNPKEISNVRGQKNGNSLRLKNLFKLKHIDVQGRQNLQRGILGLQTRTGEVSIRRTDL